MPTPGKDQLNKLLQAYKNARDNAAKGKGTNAQGQSTTTQTGGTGSTTRR
jgi:hypothetical protein